jgi:dienelactone hydrolase
VAEVVLFHHAQGLTPGVLAFAERLRSEGHVVHTPDLYDGRTFADRGEGVGYARGVGFGEIVERGRRAADTLPNEVVYGGFSLGLMPAQVLAMTKPGAKGALLFHGAIRPSDLDGSWPEGLPLQIHIMEGDEEALPPNEDLEVARELAETLEGAELYLYPGDQHLFADSCLSDYDEPAAELLTKRVLDFLARV